jgi:hypothetical protein
MDLDYIISILGEMPFENLTAVQARRKKVIINRLLLVGGVALVITTLYLANKYYKNKIQRLKDELSEARQNNKPLEFSEIEEPSEPRPKKLARTLEELKENFAVTAPNLFNFFKPIHFNTNKNKGQY